MVAVWKSMGKRKGHTLRLLGALLLLVCVSASSATVLAENGYIPMEYSTTSTELYKDKQSIPPSADVIVLGLQRLSENGFIGPRIAPPGTIPPSAQFGPGLIDQYGGGYATVLKAIAIHESAGGTLLKNPKSGALCAFQVSAGNQAALAKEEGVSVNDIAYRLLNDKAYCTQMGVRFLNEAINARGSLERGLCQYNGQVSQLKDLGWCWAQHEYAYYIGAIDGSIIGEIDTDKESETFGQITWMDQTGKVLGHTLNCQDHTETVAAALAKMADNYMLSAATIEQQVFMTTIKTSGGQSPHGQIKDTYCINDVILYMDIIQALLEGVSFYSALFTTIATEVLNAICNYIIDMTEATINNFINSLCIPMPDLTYSLSLPAVKRKTCHGQSLGDALAVAGRSLTAEQIDQGMTDLLTKSGVPAIGSLPSLSWQTPSMAGPLRAIFGSPNDKTDTKQ